MPLIEPSRFRPSWPWRNAHVQTVWPHVARLGRRVPYERERLELADGDFLDLDVATVGSTTAVVLLHGMESCSAAPYMMGMARAATDAGLDAVAMNFRGCSGEPNRLVRSYHGGESGDVHSVLQHLLATRGYTRLALVGFSLGGNMMLNYLGDGQHALPPQLRAAVGICVPMDLASCAERLDTGGLGFYGRRFIRLLVAKAVAKARRFPEALDAAAFADVDSFAAFDDRYTAPVHGFADAQSYWRACSGLRLLERIATPTLVLNAEDDPLLVPSCFPRDRARSLEHLYLEVPTHGGHVGFVAGAFGQTRWQEARALSFLLDYL